MSDPEIRCWACLRVQEVHDPLLPQDRQPVIGDVSMCFRCGLFGFFTGPDPDGPPTSTRRPTVEEQAELDVHPHAVAARAAWKEARAGYEGPKEMVERWRTHDDA